MNVVIIGAGSAGITCALEIRKLDKNIKITLIEKSNDFGYSPCALPYVISGEIKKIEDIYVFKEDDLISNNIELILDCEVKEIDSRKKTLIYNNKGIKEKINYDKLVLAIGGCCFTPQVKGIEKINYFSLKNIDDVKKIIPKIKQNTKSVIIGAGLIGVELAVSLNNKKEKVTLIESNENILASMLDKEMSLKVKEILESEGIKIYGNAKIKEILGKEILLENDKIEFDKLFFCTGIKTNSSLAKMANLLEKDKIVVNDYLQTKNKDIFACGDCVESTEFISGNKIFSQLGTTAVRQAKTIAENITGSKIKFGHVLNNTVTKIGNTFIGSVGLTEGKSKELTIETVSAKYSGKLKSEYYPSKENAIIKIVANKNGIIIGAQIISDEEIVGRINLFALAIQKKVSVKELAKLETCYNPAVSQIYDPVNIVAEICSKKIAFLKKGAK